jgi:hypothetical protein
MKIIFTLLLATVSASAAFAYDGGKLTITVPSSKSVQVYVDGRVYQDNDNTFTLNNIQTGNHTITIYKNSKNGGYGNNSNNGNYGRKRNNRNDQRDVLYSSNVYVRSSYHVDVMINRFGKALVDEKLISDKNGNWNDDAWGDDNDNDDGYNNNGYENGNNYHQAMSDYDFNQLVQKIRNQWFGKMNTAKDALNANYFNTYQVKQVLQIFSSESDKLELAKQSYKNLVDRQNFRQLYDLFSYQSQSDLDRYVKDFRY